MNPEIEMTLEEAVKEVLGQLTGLDLTYNPNLDRFRAITRQINKSLRLNALEKEWSWYVDVMDVGTATAGEKSVYLPATRRPRMVQDDAVRLLDPETSFPRVWAYFLPRDTIHKYAGRKGLWCSVTRQEMLFSRPFHEGEDGLIVQVPVMREPNMFRLPELPTDPEEPIEDVPVEILEQLIDFPYPDLITQRAAHLYAQTDPVMQPRVQTLEAQYKDLFYQISEREERHTDSPYQNDFQVPIQSGIDDGSGYGWWGAHPHSDERR